MRGQSCNIAGVYSACSALAALPAMADKPSNTVRLLDTLGI